MCECEEKGVKIFCERRVLGKIFLISECSACGCAINTTVFENLDRASRVAIKHVAITKILKPGAEIEEVKGDNVIFRRVIRNIIGLQGHINQLREENG